MKHNRFVWAMQYEFLIFVRKKWISRRDFETLLVKHVPEFEILSTARIGKEMKKRGFVIGQTTHVIRSLNVGNQNVRNLNPNQPNKKRRLNTERRRVWKHLELKPGIE